MAGKTPFRSPGARLGVEPLEDRLTPAASLITTDFTGSTPLPSDATVVGTSADGRYFIFQSAATNVVRNQITDPGFVNLFWRDTASGQTRLVSGAAGTDTVPIGTHALGVVPSVPGRVANAVISADGQAVAFVSLANAGKYDPNFAANLTLDAGDTTPDVFMWSAALAQNIDLQFSTGNVGAGNTTNNNNPTTSQFGFGPVTLASVTSAKDAVGRVTGATNPAISNDGRFVGYVSNRDASAIDPAAIDNGDLSPDVFRTSFDIATKLPQGGGGNNQNQQIPTVTVTTLLEEAVTQYKPVVVGQGQQNQGQIAFGKFSGYVQVDPLGRYMSGDGQSFVVISTLSPSQLNPTFTPSAAGTVDAYMAVFSGGTTPNSTGQGGGGGGKAKAQVPLVSLVSSAPGLNGRSVNGLVQNAILARNSPTTVVFSATVPGGSDVLVNGYQNQNGGAADLYLRSVNGGVAGPAVLVSAEAGNPTAGQNGLLDLSPGGFTISADGTAVAYVSSATNLVAGGSDTNGAFDVFAYNVSSGQNTQISVSQTGAGGNAASSNPVISTDGLAVAFESLATNLTTATDRNNGTDVFVRDLKRNTTVLASSSAGGTATGNAPSFGPVIGGTGSAATLYFNSTATNLTLGQSGGGTQEVFTVLLPLSAAGAKQALRTVALSGGRNGQAGLATFDENGNIVGQTPIVPFPGFAGEIRVASADMNGDGIVDLIAGAGPGGGPRVRVIDGATGATLADFFPFEPTFTGGVYVAAGDLNGDGTPDIIIGAGEGGGPRVKVYNGLTQQVILDAFIYESSFRGGIRVAAGDYNGDGVTDLITSAGEGGGPRVTVINGVNLSALNKLADFFAFESTLRNGVYVAAGDITGDGRADLVVGAGPGGAPRVSVFDAYLQQNPVAGTDSRIIDFFAFPSGAREGVRVAVRTVDGSGVPGLVVGNGSAGPQVRVFSLSNLTSSTKPTQLSDQFAFNDTTGTFGAFVG